MRIKFKRLALVDESLITTSSIGKNDRRLVETKASVALRDGTLAAESTATQVVVEALLGDTGSKKQKARSNG